MNSQPILSPFPFLVSTFDTLPTLYSKNEFFNIDDLVFLLFDYAKAEDYNSYGPIIVNSIKSKDTRLLRYLLEFTPSRTKKCDAPTAFHSIIFEWFCTPLKITHYPEFKKFEKSVANEITEPLAKVIINHLPPKMQRMFIGLQFYFFNNCWFHLLPEYLKGKKTIPIFYDSFLFIKTINRGLSDKYSTFYPKLTTHDYLKFNECLCKTYINNEPIKILLQNTLIQMINTIDEDNSNFHVSFLIYYINSIKPIAKSYPPSPLNKKYF